MRCSPARKPADEEEAPDTATDGLFLLDSVVAPDTLAAGRFNTPAGRLHVGAAGLYFSIHVSTTRRISNTDLRRRDKAVTSGRESKPE